jgi:hypothetical protein
VLVSFGICSDFVVLVSFGIPSWLLNN